jgi:hypothetical protein
MSAETQRTENGIDASEQCRRDELRACYEGFEFRVPAEGRVLVTNVSYGNGEKDEHPLRRHRQGRRCMGLYLPAPPASIGAL